MTRRQTVIIDRAWCGALILGVIITLIATSGDGTDKISTAASTTPTLPAVTTTPSAATSPPTTVGAGHHGADGGADHAPAVGDHHPAVDHAPTVAPTAPPTSPPTTPPTNPPTIPPTTKPTTPPTTAPPASDPGHHAHRDPGRGDRRRAGLRRGHERVGGHASNAKKGGIGGRKIVIDPFVVNGDPSAYAAAVKTACEQDFAIVGTLSVGDGETGDLTACKIPDLPTRALSSTHRGGAQHLSPSSRPPTPRQQVGGFKWLRSPTSTDAASST